MKIDEIRERLIMSWLIVMMVVMTLVPGIMSIKLVMMLVMMEVVTLPPGIPWMLEFASHVIPHR